MGFLLIGIQSCLQRRLQRESLITRICTSPKSHVLSDIQCIWYWDWATPTKINNASHFGNCSTSSDIKSYCSFPGERHLAEVPLPASDVQGPPPSATSTALPGSAARSGRIPPSSPSQFRAKFREGIPPRIYFGGKFKFKLNGGFVGQEVHGKL